MDCITFENVSFTYPESETKTPVFSHFTGTIPAGFTSLVGPNGTGKTTFMMLASGRLLPQEGCCMLFGKNPALLAEEQKNLLASVIYQNMEFESTEKVEQLLTHVYTSGNYKGKAKAIRSSQDLFGEVLDVFEIKNVLGHGLTQLSKGEIQRVLLAFSILYGSASIFMDEPMFAMEGKQKKSSLKYLREFSDATKTPIYISMHELELTREFAQQVLLFYPNRDIDLGSPEEVMTNEALEKAYGVPASMLSHSESMTREELQQTADAILTVQRNA
ncbi:MAG TPA: ABC transporter [Treponema sp.]|nr:ABC transporter [Treponema sp.]HBD67715.1 ABC transporter [Treponema sp.]